MMSEIDSAVAALGPEPHDMAHPTVDETDSISHSSTSSDDRPSDSNSNPQDANDQLQSHLMQQLLTMANHPHPEAVGDPKSLRELIEEHESEVNVKDDDTGMTPLHVAAEKGLVGAVGELLRAGADLESQDCEGFTPLMTATREQKIEVMRKLLNPPPGHSGNKKAQLEIRSRTGRTPILWASIYGFLDCVVLLIDAGADYNAQTWQSSATPLIAASFWGSEDIVEALLNNGNPKGCADLTLSDDDRRTALHAAVTGEHLEIAKLLLDAEATLTTLQDAFDQTPLHLAVDQGSESLIKLLARADVNVFGESRQTALHLACKKGDRKVALWLLEEKAEINAKDAEDNTPLHLAFHALLEVQEQLTLDSPAFSDLSVGDGPNAELQQQLDQLVATIHLLLDRDAQIKISNYKEETPLRLAAESGECSVFDRIVKSIEQKGMFISNDDVQAALSSVLRLEVQRRATLMTTLLESDSVEVASFGEEDAWKVTLNWAANDSELHGIAQLLLRKMPRKQEILPPCITVWSAIAWAAHEQLPEILFALISTSPGNPEMEEALTSAIKSTLELVEKADNREACDQLPLVLWFLITASKETKRLRGWLDQALSVVEKWQEVPPDVLPTSTQKSREDYEGISRVKTIDFGNPDRDDGHGRGNNDEAMPDTKKQVSGSNQRSFKPESLETLKDILRDPPFARVHKEPMHYDIPQSRIKGCPDDVLTKFKATIVQFHGAKGVSGTLEAKRPIRDVIYDVGPKEIMQTWTSMQKAVAELSGDAQKGKLECDFTWVHLPATNMDWMNDLLARIMKDEKCNPHQYYKAKSFFQESWVEVPDERSDSRIMRPRTVLRKPEKTEDKHEQSEETGNQKTKKKERSKQEHTNVVAKSAIYMPYFCFSVNLDDNPQAAADHDSLLEAYKTKSPQSIIHRSPTLDEWYYQFADDDDSLKDRAHRNRTQVVTQYWEAAAREDNAAHRRDLTSLVRVNQVWIWTIDNKWLITATSCLFSNYQGTLVQGILDQLSKQAKHRGRKSQPRSAVEMSKLVVDYCIGSYERRPNLESQTPLFCAGLPENPRLVGEQQLSISQIYSNHMNKIGRAETALYSSFKDQKRMQIELERNVFRSRLERLFPKWLAQFGNDMEKAINEAEKLYSDIKDVRDELNILKSVAQYQRTVQRGLYNSQVKNTDLNAASVVSNIVELDDNAARIQSAVNTTLSLQQNEIAKIQAKLSGKQAELAGKQGKVLMVFTFATLLFLPLSFLSSLFALDVSSFLQTPAWAYLIIFLGSTMVSVVIGLVAFFWENITQSFMFRIFRGLVRIFRALVRFFWSKIIEYGEIFWRKSRELKASASKCFRS